MGVFTPGLTGVLDVHQDPLNFALYTRLWVSGGMGVRDQDLGISQVGVYTSNTAQWYEDDFFPGKPAAHGFDPSVVSPFAF